MSGNLAYAGPDFTDGSRRFLYADHIGSITGITDNAGTALVVNTYDPYGVGDPQNFGRFAFTGQVQIPELNLYYYKARTYSPELGRFTQTDPVGYEDQMNLYAYVANDPVNNIDPEGKKLRFASGSTALFKKQFAQIIQYHNAHGTSAVFARLEALPDTVTIQEGTSHAFGYRPSTDTITFDPT